MVVDVDCAAVEACRKPAWKSTWTFSLFCYKKLTFNNRADFTVANGHIVGGPDNGVTKILQA